MSASPNPILVALSNPDTVRPLVGVAAAVAKQRGAPLFVGTVLRQGNGVPPSVAQESPEERKAAVLVSRGVRFAKDCGLEDVTGGTERADAVRRGIIRAVRRHNPGLLFLGYSDLGDPFAKSGRRFNRLIDDVGMNVDCSLAIVSLRGQFPFRRLLFPVAGGVNLNVTADVVPALKSAGAKLVTFMHMVAPQVDLPAARGRLHELLDKHGLAESGELVVRATENVQRALIRESSKYDLTVVGAPRQKLLARIFGDTAERVARQSKKSVMIIRAQR